MTALEVAPTTEDEHLDRIYEAHKRAQAALNDLREAVWAARHAKPRAVTWEKIGDTIGITRQGAAERFKRRPNR